MTVRYSTYWFDTALSSGGNYGLFTVGAGNVLTKVTVKTAITFPIETTTDTGSQFTADTLVGLSWLVHGSSPLTLPAGIDDVRLLGVQGIDPGSFTAAWSPSSDTAAVGVGGGITMIWRGQMVAVDDMDLAFVVGTLGGSTDGWFLYGSMELWLG